MAKASHARLSTQNYRKKTIVGLIEQIAYGHSRRQVFSDVMELIAITISNAVDPRHVEAEKREATYLERIKRYKSQHHSSIAQILSELTLAMEEDPGDILGEVFMELGLGNDRSGQFFTPYHLCRLMANLVADDKIETEIDRLGFAVVSEPACGGGAMIIALAETLLAKRINYQQCMHVTAVDVDVTAVHMTYIQLSLLGIPAIVVHGNTLTLEEYSHWRTPIHIWGNWEAKLTQRNREEMRSEVVKPIPADGEDVIHDPIDEEDAVEEESIQMAFL